MIVKIDGQVVNYQFGSLDIEDAIGQRSTASFNVIDKAGSLKYKKGQPVEIFEDDGISKVFGGVIDTPVSKYISLASQGKVHSITCADWHYIADKRIVAKIYVNELAGNIVKDIIANYLSDDGITEGTIQDGPVVTEAVFNYITATKSFESLSELAGHEFYIDANKALHFFHRATNYNSTTITETSDIKDVQLEPSAESYRNKQYVRAGKDTTDVQTEKFLGNGEQRSFTVAYPIAKVPTIKVNGVSKSVGIRGLDSGKEWYWNKGENTISQDDSATPLSSSQTITIDYQGLFDIVVVSYDHNAIDERQSVEGGSGIHEDVIDEPYITSRASAFESASAKLKRYASIGNKISFLTKINGFRAGQLIPVKLDSYGLDDYFLIESIFASELGTSDGRLIYQISCVDGAATGGWAKFFKQIATRGQTFVIRENIQENEILTTLEQFSKTWTSNEQPNIFALLQPSATTQPGTSTFPSFEVEDRVKYLVFYNSLNEEFFRKALTKREDSEGQIVSTTYIAPFDANTEDIAYVGWFGGWQATENNGTGVLVDKQPFNKIKTTMESIQVEKIDIRG